MKNLLSLGLAVVVLAGCGGDNSNDIADQAPPPMEPPVVNPPVNPPPPQMQSFAAFTRTVFADGENAAPRATNDIEFNRDAADDDFADLLQ